MVVIIPFLPLFQAAYDIFPVKSINPDLAPAISFFN